MNAARPMRRWVWMPLLLAALMAALWAAMLRLGWPMPAHPADLAALHGPLMISGFLGTLVSLERAVALNWKWSYAAPALALAGSAALMIGGLESVANICMTLASVVLLLTMAVLARRFRMLYMWVMVVAVICWVAGNGLWWAGFPVARVVGLWSAFLVLFIAAERLELSRIVAPPKRSKVYFVVAAFVILLGVALGLVFPDAGSRVLGIGFIAMAGWLNAYDVARPVAGLPAATKFMSIGLRLGYFWLAIGGLLATMAGAQTAGPTYDAELHTVFVGFVFSMILAHSIVILPAVLGLPQLAFPPALYLPFWLLHVSLFFRIAGDLRGDMVMRRSVGTWNAVAILLHFAILGFTVRRTMVAAARAKG